MTKKLLNKTLGSYLIFSVIVLLTAAPVFYFATEALYREDADETLLINKNNFFHYSIPNMLEADIAVWNKMNRDIKIESATPALSKDTFFFQSYYDTLHAENEPYRILKTPVIIHKQPYTFTSKISLIESEDLIENIVLLFSIVLLLLLSGFYLLTKRFSLQLWKPFYKSLDYIEKFEIDKDLTVFFEESEIEEFNRLNQALTKFTVRNIRIYNGQREFIENAAHELQTPLAVFQAKIDTLFQRSDITEGQSEILSKLDDTATRLIKLNKNLLLLSKLESKQFAETETVLLNSIVEKQISFFEEQASAKNCQINLLIKEQLFVKSNPVLAEILISNLFLNAIRHNIQNGSILIKLEKNSITFSNNGINEMLVENRLFQRFNKTAHETFHFNSESSVKEERATYNKWSNAPVNSVKYLNSDSPGGLNQHLYTSGNGLGLAIIKKIADLNSWKINYNFQNNLHNFTLILPEHEI
ncbi:MAG: HAMP domain-containing histidine kinase [Bacteroidia bacterium]|nr:HAMP domain-containing histidine kinase [Bacteroidia bacterium]